VPYGAANKRSSEMAGPMPSKAKLGNWHFRDYPLTGLDADMRKIGANGAERSFDLVPPEGVCKSSTDGYPVLNGYAFVPRWRIVTLGDLWNDVH
jgi:hypothetical protein